MGFVANAYESLAVSGSSVSFTAATYGNADSVIAQVEDDAIRFRLDGTAPTASVGFVALPGAIICLNSQDMVQRFRAIRVTGDGVLRTQFGRGLDFFGVYSAPQVGESAGTGAVADTELPAAAALADAAANPTTPTVGADLLGFNGTTWDRLRTRGTGILQVESAFSFLNVAAGQATTTVKSGAGTLHTINMWGPPTATGTFTVYDNTAASGTKIATVLAAGVLSATTFTFDLAFGTGLTIITATANWADYTVTYR